MTRDNARPYTNSSADSDDGRLLIARAREDVAEAARVGGNEHESPVPPIALPGLQIIRELHRGGQGVVYEAIQIATRRRVAVKVLHAYVGAQERARFEREVDVLAQVRHPNIVTLHDANIEDGVPYLVMDLIEGETLDEHVRRHDLSLTDVLNVFVKICSAVQAAHLRGVIHRDLKPGNIRVDDAGEPHVLDFGLAKLVEKEPHAKSRTVSITETGQFVGSLPWATPEQARGDVRSMDVRADVYALGIILYQLLTGRFPYNVDGGTRKVFENILTAEPTKASNFRRDIDDDVDTILLKCLQKKPDRRYQGVAELAHDVQRYLADQPIEAKRDSFWYVFGKAVRRYRAAVLVFVLFLMMLVGYGATTTVLLRRAHRAEGEKARLADDARAKFRLVHETVHVVLRELSTQLERISGASNARHAILEAAYTKLVPLVRERSDDPALLADLGLTYYLLGDIALKIGNIQDGRNHLFSALEIRRRLTQESPETLSYWDELSINLVRLGDSYGEVGERRPQLDYYLEALQIDEDLVRRDPANTHFHDNLGWSYQRLSGLTQTSPELPDNEALATRSTQVFERLVEEEPQNPLRLYGLCFMKNHLGTTAELKGDWTMARRLHEEALALAESAVAMEPDNPDYLRYLARSYTFCSYYSRRSGELKLTKRWLDQAEAILVRLMKDAPTTLLNPMQLARVLDGKAELTESEDNWPLEHEYLVHALNLTTAALAQAPDHLELLRLKFTRLHHLAVRKYEHGDEGVRALSEEALLIAEQVVSRPEANEAQWRSYSGLLREAVPPELRDTNKSVFAADKAIEVAGAKNPQRLSNLAEALARNGELDRARTVQAEALSLLPPGDSPIRQSIIDTVLSAPDDINVKTPDFPSTP